MRAMKDVRLWLVAVLACSIASGACGSGSGDGGDDAPNDSADGGPATADGGAGGDGDLDGGGPADAPSPPVDGGGGGDGSARCGQPAGATGLVTKMIDVGGVSRRYRVFVPTTYDPAVATRLVFVFHGLGGDGNLIRSYFGFEANAAGQALFVYPDGLPIAGGQTGWAASDLPFFDAMVTELSATYCVDAQRIFATGHSFGGYMSNLVGCSRGAVVRAIAPVSGGLLGGTCDRPVAAWLAHGTNDTTVNVSQGSAARDRWRTANGCAAGSQPVEPSPCVTYDGCGAGYPVVWCAFAGGHFPLPAFIKPAIWSFFAGF
jgi:poly(3-hydroxybutyrate) depolymerase